MALLEGGVSLGAGFELPEDLNHPQCSVSASYLRIEV